MLKNSILCCNILCILTAIHTVPKNLRRKTDHVRADAAVYVWFLCQIQVHMQYVHLCNVQKNQTYTVASAPAVTGYKVFMRRLNMFLGERSARMLLNNNITVYNITFVKRCFSCYLTQQLLQFIHKKHTQSSLMYSNTNFDHKECLV